MKPIWARNIKKRRVDRGLGSAEKFAEKLEMPYPTYRDIEGGASEGGFDKREVIAQALSWTVADLYKDHTKPSTNADFTDAAAFLTAYADATPDIQKAILAFLFVDESPKYLRQVSAEALTNLIRLLSSAIPPK